MCKANDGVWCSGGGVILILMLMQIQRVTAGTGTVRLLVIMTPVLSGSSRPRLIMVIIEDDPHLAASKLGGCPVIVWYSAARIPAN